MKFYLDFGHGGKDSGAVGFPIALSMYLLVRIEGKLQTLSDSINELSKNIISMR